MKFSKWGLFKLVGSMAPTIFGDQDIKCAVLLSGGVHDIVNCLYSLGIPAVVDPNS